MTLESGTGWSLDQQVRNMQIVKLALILGVTAFGGYVFFIAPRPAPPINLTLTWGLAALGGLVILARLMVPPMIVRTAVQRIALGKWQPIDSMIPVPTTDEARLASIYQSQMLVGTALLEGGAFANIISCMLTGHVVSWVLSGILWLGMVIDFPTRVSVQRWLESKQAWLNDERSLAGRPNERR